MAIKILRRDSEPSEEELSRFDREARTISNIDHPNICKLYDVGRDADVDFLVMQHVEGETLAMRLKSGPLPLDEAYRVAIEVSDALATAHRQGVVHRDLKPGNIMLGKSGAMVLDFGLAKLIEPVGDEPRLEAERPTEELQTKRGTILGTPQYLTPEQLEGRQADSRSDIFAFGAMLYEMVTGRRAFDGDNPTHVADLCDDRSASIDLVDQCSGATRARADRRAMSGQGPQ